MSTDGYFGFARINGFLVLVQVSTPLTALGAVDVKIFRHEFINIFRFSEFRTFHPTDIRMVDQIDDDRVRYEEDNETVFLSRDAMGLMRNLIDTAATSQKRCVRGGGGSTANVMRLPRSPSRMVYAIQAQSQC